MRFEERRELPVSLKKMWDYTTDCRTWPDWYASMTEIVKPGPWAGKGDTVDVAYKVLGRRLEFSCKIEEFKEHESIRFGAHLPKPLPLVHQHWTWEELGNDRVALSVTIEGDDPTNWFGKIIDRTVLPGIYRRDLANSLDNLAQMAAAGLPK